MEVKELEFVKIRKKKGEIKISIKTPKGFKLNNVYACEFFTDVEFEKEDEEAK